VSGRGCSRNLAWFGQVFWPFCWPRSALHSLLVQSDWTDRPRSKGLSPSRTSDRRLLVTRAGCPCLAVSAPTRHLEQETFHYVSVNTFQISEYYSEFTLAKVTCENHIVCCYVISILATYPAHRNLLHFTTLTTPTDLNEENSFSLFTIHPGYIPSPS
jgi:hypothetical protein